MRVIIYTGKGGVGKTSVAAAAALRASELGYRTLVFSTDASHSLGDSFDKDLGHEPTEVAPKLWAIETNAYADLEANWGVVRTHIANIITLQGMNEVLADEAAILPGMDEIFSLARIKDYRDSGQYDCIIVDAASTGETLRLLSLPQTLSWTVKLLRKADKYILKPIVRPLSRLSPELEEMIAPEEVFEAIEKMLLKLKAIKKLLADSSQTSLRLVMNAEKMVIKESKRALTYFNMYGLLVDGVVVNRLLSTDSGYLESWREIQQRYLDEVKTGFSPLPVQTAPQYHSEVVGIANLSRLAKDLYGECDPTLISFNETVFEIRKQKGEYSLKMRLQLLDKEKLRIRSTANDLILQVENQRRIISLPSAMSGYRPSKATYENNYLTVYFNKRKKGEQ